MKLELEKPKKVIEYKNNYLHVEHTIYSDGGRTSRYSYEQLGKPTETLYMYRRQRWFRSISFHTTVAGGEVEVELNKLTVGSATAILKGFKTARHPFG